jgi:hypothetical protein
MRTTHSLSRRLAAVEDRLLPGQMEWLPGVLELHFTQAWPDCHDARGHNFRQCTEHWPTCGVSVSSTRERRRVVITMGGPWLGV